MVSHTDRINSLEADMTKLREETEAIRSENAMKFQEVLKAISDLTLAVGKKESSDDEASGEKKGKRFEDKGRDPLGGFRKIKAPIFDGDDPYGWIYRVERFFEIQGIKEHDHLRAAAICMDGAALAWYRWCEGRDFFRSWEDLKQRLLERFQPSQEGGAYEQLLAIRQDGLHVSMLVNLKRWRGNLEIYQRRYWREPSSTGSNQNSGQQLEYCNQIH